MSEKLSFDNFNFIVNVMFNKHNPFISRNTMVKYMLSDPNNPMYLTDTFNNIVLEKDRENNVYKATILNGLLSYILKYNKEINAAEIYENGNETGTKYFDEPSFSKRVQEICEYVCSYIDGIKLASEAISNDIDNDILKGLIK